MKNEAAAFSSQPELPNEINASKEETAKKSASLLEFPQKKEKAEKLSSDSSIEEIDHKDIDALSKIAKGLNAKLKEIDNMSRKEDEEEIEKNDREILRREGYTEDEIEEEARLLKEEEDNDPELQEYLKKLDKYDDERIIEIINELERHYQKNLLEANPGLFTIKSFADMWQVSEGEALNILEQKRKWEEERYKPYADRLKSVFRFKQILKDVSLDKVFGTELAKNEKDVARIISIAEANNAEDDAMKRLVIDGIESGLQNEKTEFFVLRHKGEIVAFCRFDDNGDHFYFGSFNVDPDYRGSAIGEVMMRESLFEKAKEKPIHAITEPGKEICSKYIELGFIVSGIDRAEIEGEEILGVKIVLDKTKKEKYCYHQSDKKDIVTMHRQQQKEIKSKKISLHKLIENRKSFIIAFDKESEMEKFYKFSEGMMEKGGYVISRYFSVDKDGKKMLAAFEQNLR